MHVKYADFCGCDSTKYKGDNYFCKATYSKISKARSKVLADIFILFKGLFGEFIRGLMVSEDLWIVAACLLRLGGGGDTVQSSRAFSSG